jgi:hypothetical protein
MNEWVAIDAPTCEACASRFKQCRLWAALIGGLLIAGYVVAGVLIESVVVLFGVVTPIFMTLVVVLAIICWRQGPSPQCKFRTSFAVGVSDDVLQTTVGWKRSGAAVLIPWSKGGGKNSVLDSFYVPVFRNREYQLLFDKANGLDNKFGLPFGPELEKRLVQEEKKRFGSY